MYPGIRIWQNTDTTVRLESPCCNVGVGREVDSARGGRVLFRCRRCNRTLLVFTSEEEMQLRVNAAAHFTRTAKKQFTEAD